MRYAVLPNKERINPLRSGQRALCSSCREPVVAKCGRIKSAYWSHLSGSDCDSWAESLTEWHVVWQKYLETNKGAKIEVPITRSGITHRADAVLWNGEGNIVELQHSGISPDEIEERERFYGNKLVWIFNVREAYKTKRFEFRKADGNKRTFRWKQPRKSIAFAKRPVFLDLGHGYMFQLEKLFPTTPCGGFGILHLSFRVEGETILES